MRWLITPYYIYIITLAKSWQKITGHDSNLFQCWTGVDILNSTASACHITPLASELEVAPNKRLRSWPLRKISGHHEVSIMAQLCVMFIEYTLREGGERRRGTIRFLHLVKALTECFAPLPLENIFIYSIPYMGTRKESLWILKVINKYIQKKGNHYGNAGIYAVRLYKNPSNSKQIYFLNVISNNYKFKALIHIWNWTT